MKNYYHHVKSKSTHERREHAMRIAGIVTVAVFVGWVGTLGVRLASNNPSIASSANSATASNSDTSGADQTQVAGVGAADQSATQTSIDPNANTLQVSTSSVLTQ